MKINPNDPCDKMPIRLKLAAMIVQGLLAGCGEAVLSPGLSRDAFARADDMIDRANREETGDDV